MDATEDNPFAALATERPEANPFEALARSSPESNPFEALASSPAASPPVTDESKIEWKTGTVVEPGTGLGIPSAPTVSRRVSAPGEVFHGDYDVEQERERQFQKEYEEKGAFGMAKELAMTPLAKIVPNMTPEEAGKWARLTDVSGIYHLLPHDVSNRVAGVVENVTADTVNFFTSPLGIATLGIGALPKLAQQTVSAAFAATALKEAPESISNIATAKTPEERDAAIRGAIENAMVIGGAGAHLLARARTAAVAHEAATLAPETTAAAASLEEALNAPITAKSAEPTPEPTPAWTSATHEPEAAAATETPPATTEAARPVEATTPEPAKAPEPPAAVPGHGIRPALALGDEKRTVMAEGEAGQDHAELMPEALAKQGPDDHTPLVHGFKVGDKFLTRIEGAKWMLDNGLINKAKFDEMMTRKEPGLTSQDLSKVTGEAKFVTSEQRHESLRIEEVPISELKLSKDVPQFKQGANEKGIVTPLTGKFTREGVAPIAVWERLDGTREVISGRHRFDLAQRSGEKTIPAQIYRESEGVTPKIAASIDAELNIRDDKGSAADYAQHFKNSGIDKTTAEQRGLLGSAKGKAGWSIARSGSEDLLALHRAGEITDAQAQAIAEGASGNADAQRIGSRAALDGKSAGDISKIMGRALAQAGGGAKQLDLLGADDSAMRKMADEAKAASAAQREIQTQINAVEGAAKNPAAAKKFGVDVNDPQSILSRVAELRAEKARWDKYWEYPDLLAKIEGKPEAELPTLPKGQKKGTGELFQGKDAPFNLAGEEAPDALKTAEEKAAAEKAAKEAKEKQDREQTDMFGSMKRKSGEAGAIPIPKVVSDALQKVGEKVKAVVREIRDVKKMDDLDKATTRWSRKQQVSFAEAHQAAAEITAVAKAEKARAGMNLYREAGGDMAKLAMWEARAKGRMFREAAKAAQHLTPEQIALTAGRIAGMYDALETRGNTHDVLGSHRDNYVTHVWDVENQPAGTSANALKARFKFSKARTFNTFFEGDQAGFIPKTLDLAKLVPAYMIEMNRVIADKQWVREIMSAKTPEGEPLAVPRGNAKTVDTSVYAVVKTPGGRAVKLYDTKAEADAAVLSGQSVEERPSTSALVAPRGFNVVKDRAGNPIDTRNYRTLEQQPALSNWRWVESDPQGNTTILKSDLALHPDAAKRLNAMIGASKLKLLLRSEGSALTAIPKAIGRAIDTSQSVMKREMFGLISLFHPVQEGTHAIGHWVNPITIGEKIDPVNNAAQRAAMEDGLMLLPDKATMSSYLEGVGGERTFLSRLIRKAGKGGQAIADVFDGYQDDLFHVYIPQLKFKTYEAIKARNLERFKGEIASGELNARDVGMLSAQQANAAYGHLNYALLDRSPTVQHFLRLTALAPDFLEARGRFTGQAAKSLLGSKAGNEQFMAIAKLAALQAALAYTVTQLSGDKWDPKHPFEVVHGGRRYSMRSVPEDIASALTDFTQFSYGRMNPLTVRGGVQLATGRNYRGEEVSKLDTAEELLAGYIPIVARSLPGVRELTKTSKMQPVSPLEQFAGTVGLRVSRYSPISKTHQLATDWMEKEGLPKEKGVYPISKYQQYRYALEDADMDRAKAEFDKLAKTETPGKIRAGFRESVNSPFTRSQAMDQKFKKSLPPEDRALYDIAIEKRRAILRRAL